MSHGGGWPLLPHPPCLADLLYCLSRPRVLLQYDRRKDFDHIVIETTGLANPAPIISSFYMDQELPNKCVT